MEVRIQVASSVRRITAHTGLLGVIGYPVDHSLSPLMHNAALEHQGLDLVYLAFPVDPSALAEAVSGARALGMRGFNVTVPHKAAIVALLDRLDALAARVGAVNTVVNDGGSLVGYNTDVTGFLEALATVWPRGASGSRLLVAGAGGAARAVVAAACANGASRVWVLNRTRERAAALCEAAQAWGATPCRIVEAGMLSEAMADADILVNATSVGMAETVKLTPFPVDIVDARHVVVDLVYGSSQTALVTQARAKGIVAIDGKEMLLRQAASSYLLWTGREAPLDVMRLAIRSVGS